MGKEVDVSYFAFTFRAICGDPPLYCYPFLERMEITERSDSIRCVLSLPKDSYCDGVISEDI